MANQLPRKPLLIPTDFGNVSNRSVAPTTDQEHLSAYFLWYCFYIGSLGKLSSTMNAVSSSQKAYYRLEASNSPARGQTSTAQEQGEYEG